jgi:hypothetical protein
MRLSSTHHESQRSAKPYAHQLGHVPGGAEVHAVVAIYNKGTLSYTLRACAGRVEAAKEHAYACIS